MANAASRASQLTTAFAREAERLKESSGAAENILASLIATLRDAGTGAQTLIGESAAQAKHDARSLVGEAMAECERLLRAAGEMSAEAQNIRTTLAKTIEDFEHHLVRLPTLAQGEAQRIRQMMQSETDQLLDLSARTISTIHARSAHERGPRLPASSGIAAEQTEADGLKGLARKLTQRPKRKDSDLRGAAHGLEGKNWEMRKLLAAADTDEGLPRELGARQRRRDGRAATGALADMAVDLESISADATPGNDDWKLYLAGDRSVFARKLAGAVDDAAIDRIATLYREDDRFHEAADAYLSEFESLLARARDGDSGGLLTSTILSADTGKIYLAIAYALGRLTRGPLCAGVMARAHGHDLYAVARRSCSDHKIPRASATIKPVLVAPHKSRPSRPSRQDRTANRCGRSPAGAGSIRHARTGPPQSPFRG